MFILHTSKRTTPFPACSAPFVNASISAAVLPLGRGLPFKMTIFLAMIASYGLADRITIFRRVVLASRVY